ncbi:hypothetical protein OAE80_04100, partial [Planctomycetaceae bacterium]|nr:hypothetical protein [Planctomycetaceae bacterium]
MFAVLVVLGAAFAAEAQDPYGSTTPFPGLNGNYNSTSPATTPDYLNDGYHTRYPSRTTPAYDDFGDRWSPQDFDSGRRQRTRDRSNRDRYNQPAPTRDYPIRTNPSDGGFDFPVSTPTSPASPYRDRMPVVDPEVEQLQKQQQSISFRYSNPVLMRFMQTLDVNRAVTLYREISDMVDRRHMKPTSYAERVEKSLGNLAAAAENTDFQQANSLRLSAAGIETFQQAIVGVSRQANVRTRSDAEQVMSQSMSVARQYLGLRSEVVAMEFIFGTTDTLDKYSAFVPDDVRQG